MSTEKYAIVGDWLCVETGTCTCGTPMSSYPHEQYCGIENLTQIDNLLEEHERLKADNDQMSATIDRVAKFCDDADSFGDEIETADIRAALEGKA
jgi:hypothetical protein